MPYFHGLVKWLIYQSLLLLLLQWNAVNTVTNGPNKIGHIDEGFFYKNMYGSFKFSNQVAVMMRWPERQGFTVYYHHHYHYLTIIRQRRS